jgi:hypothetical protein
MMKKILILYALMCAIPAYAQTPNTPPPKTDTNEENFNSHVALAGIANMVNGFSNIITDKEGSPGNLITSAAQIFVGLANIVVELCKNLPLDQEVRREHIEEQLNLFTPEQKTRLMALLKAYYDIVANTRFTSCGEHGQP